MSEEQLALFELPEDPDQDPAEVEDPLTTDEDWDEADWAEGRYDDDFNEPVEWSTRDFSDLPVMWDESDFFGGMADTFDEPPF